MIESKIRVLLSSNLCRYVTKEKIEWSWLRAPDANLAGVIL